MNPSKLIYSHLGGDQFKKSVNANYIAFGDSSLTFKIMSGTSVKYCRIIDNGGSYRCEFYGKNSDGVFLKSQYNQITSGNLIATFSLATGLYTSLFPN